MTDEHRSKDDLPIDDAVFVERLKAAYEPRPMTGARRAALDARVRDRIERSSWPGRLAPALAAAVVAVALVWGVWSDIGVDPVPTPAIARVEVPEADGWETGLYLYDGSLEADETEGVAGEFLPPEYAAIDRFFFDG